MTAPFLPSMPRFAPRIRCRYPRLIDAAMMCYGGQALERTYTTSATVTVLVAVKRGALGTMQPILGSTIYFDANDHLVAWGATTPHYFRDPNGWYLIEAGPSGLMVNGRLLLSELATTALVNVPWARSGSTYLDGLIADAHIIDGADVVGAATAWRGESCVWMGHDGEHGPAGTHLDFADQAQLGLDAAGIGNWTPSGSPLWTLDTPTDNFPVVDRLLYVPSWSGYYTSRANTRSHSGPYNADGMLYSPNVPIPVLGKWYAEFTMLSYGYTPCHVGVTGALWNKGGTSGLSGTFGVGNVVGVAPSPAEGIVKFFRDGVPVGTLPWTPTNERFFDAYGVGNVTVTVWDHAYGQRGFVYAPPEGHSGIHTALIPDDPGTIIDAGSYLGNGVANGARVITGAEMESIAIGGTTYVNDGSARGVVDFLCDGFKLRSTTHNVSGTTYPWTGVVRVPWRCALAGIN